MTNAAIMKINLPLTEAANEVGKPAENAGIAPVRYTGPKLKVRMLSAEYKYRRAMTRLMALDSVIG